MYQHAFVPIDCSDDARQAVLDLVPYFAAMTFYQATLIATVTPSPSAEVRTKKVKHTQEALRGLQEMLVHDYGVYTRSRLLEASDGAAAIAAAAQRSETPCDVIVMSTYQTRTEDYDAPCQGSLVDRISQHATVPVIILPRQQQSLCGK